MRRYAIFRQAHNPSSHFLPVKQFLRQRHRWDEDGDGKMEEWVGLPDGKVASEDFDRAAAFLVRALAGGRSLTVLVDEINPLGLDPLRSGGWHSLLAMLILAFPEVRWHALLVVGRPTTTGAPNDLRDPDLRRWLWFQSRHGISALHEVRGTPLFDGYGLRQHVLSCMFQERPSLTRSVPHRKALATVLDEEEGYRWLLAYMAYRHGFRACAIASWREAENLLGRDGLLHRTDEAKSDLDDFVLSLEDWFLSYPDQTGRSGLSDLRLRVEELPALAMHAPPLRRFLTVGHLKQSAIKAEKREGLLSVLRENELAYTAIPLQPNQQVSFKPASGLFTLWRELGLNRDWNSTGKYAWDDFIRSRYVGLAPGYFWPPDVEREDDYLLQYQEDGHSSPGRLTHIAEHLIERANGLIRETNTATDALRGAVLATEALELLGAKTPTVSVEALLLKHAFEVTAECQFPGVEYHLNLKERFADIRANLGRMSQWLNSSRQQDFQLNAEALILSKLASILEEHGEYEEFEFCQMELRSLHRRIQVRFDKKTRPPFLWILIYPFRLYIEFVLRSSLHFLGTIFVLILLFMGLHSLDPLKSPPTASNGAELIGEHQNSSSSMTESPADGSVDNLFYDAFKAVVSGEPVDKSETTFGRRISYAATLLGVLNLGILISVLHTRMNRR